MADKDKKASLRKIVAPLPLIKRGYGIHVYGTSKGGDKIVYTAGRLVVVRNLDDPSTSVIFTEHKAPANVAKFSPNGNWIASGDSEGNVFVWELLTLVVKTRVQVCSNVLDIDWDPEGKRIVAVGDGSTKARCFSWDSGTALGKIEGHHKPILSVAYRPTKPSRIVTASEDLNVNIYEGPPFKFLKTSTEHARYPNVIRYAPDGETFVTVGADSKIVIWDGKTGDKVRVIENKKDGHKGSIFGASYSPDGKQLLTASGDKTAKIWNLEDGSVVKTFTFGEELGHMQTAALWHKGEKKEYLITVGLSGAINILNPDSPSSPFSVQGIQAAPTDLVVDRKAGAFYISNIEGYVSRYDWKDGNGTFFSGKGHGKTVKAVGVSGDLAITAGYDDKVIFTDTKSLKFGESVSLGGQPVGLAVGNKDSSVVVIPLANQNLLVLKGKEVKTTLALGFVPTCVDISPDDTEVAVGGKDKKVHCFTLSGTSLTKGREITLDKELVTVKYRPDGSMISTIDKAKQILFWDKDGKQLNDGWVYHAATVTSGAWSPSGNRFATGSADESVIVWSDFKKFDDTARLHIKDAHSQGVDLVAFYDEDTLISVGSDRSVKFWDLPKLA